VSLFFVTTERSKITIAKLQLEEALVVVLVVLSRNKLLFLFISMTLAEAQKARTMRKDVPPREE
jgi:hypothetical protein